MKIKLLLLTVVTLLVSAVFYSGCTKKQSTRRIGVTFYNDNDWRGVFRDELAQQAALHDDLDLDFRSATDTVEVQLRDLRYFIDNKYDAIVIDPFLDERVEDLIREASAQSIPVIIYDRKTTNNCFAAYVKADNETIGRRAADFLNDKITGAAEIIEIQGWELSQATKDRHKGFAERLDEYDNISLVGTATSNWTWSETEGRRIADSLLNAHPNVKGIFAHSDRLAMHVKDVIRELNLNNDIIVIGVDATPEVGVKAVMDGFIDATFIYPTGTAEVLKTARKIWNHEQVDRTINLPPAMFIDSVGAHDVLLSTPVDLY